MQPITNELSLINVELKDFKPETIWFSADAHFMHFNIIRYCERPFTTAQDMDEVLIQNWNNCIGDNDTVFYLGDFSMNPIAYRAIIPKLKFGKMYFVIGNHDRKNQFIKYIEENNLQDKIILGKSFILKYQDKEFFLTHRPINAHTELPTISGHVHEKWKRMNAGETVTEGAPLGKLSRSIILKQTVLNVGVDIFNFAPINMTTVLQEIDKI